MKQKWLDLIERLDALSLRERLFLFLSVVVCLGAVLDTLWLTPALSQHKQLTARIDKQSTELQRLRDTLRTSVRPAGAGPGGQEESVKISAQIEEVNQAIRQLLPDASQSAPLAQALVHLLRRHDGLTLVHTAAVPPETAGPGTVAGPGVAGLPPGVTRQGVMLTVAGPYAELVRYVASLETAMPQVRWGQLSLKSDKGMLPELTLNLFLLGERAP
jgi:MSHA biogenesis protein MshJ